MTCSDIMYGMCVIIDIGACMYVVNKLVYDCMLIVVRALITIDHLHTSLKEFIKVLIAVTSRLDAVVACINVLHPMENQ